MGYNHSWMLKTPFTKGFIEDVKECIEDYHDILVNVNMSEQEIKFDGLGEAGFETFWFRRTVGGWCKTDQRAYDEPICMILLLAIHHFGDDFTLGSSGLSQITKDMFQQYRLNDYWPEALEKVKDQFGYSFKIVQDDTHQQDTWYYVSLISGN
ncbi:hypothetical protein [Salipaludibacillus sp. CF4.18]|uniref:hypothetical protein n=1 Tax=Salipaludibacillus sp. CF4.18 TaxID=3373081 RepID=UPI003EE4F51C